MPENTECNQKVTLMAWAWLGRMVFSKVRASRVAKYAEGFQGKVPTGASYRPGR